MAYKIKKRCIRCLKVLRKDGTCGNEKCSRYTPEKPKEELMMRDYPDINDSEVPF